MPANEVYQRMFESYAALRRDATVLDHLVPLAAHLVSEQLPGRLGPRSSSR